MAGKILRENLDTVEQTVKSQDRDRYVSVLFAQKAKHHPLFTLYAFNVELARIAETVSEPLLGEIKLQWWREALEKIERNEDTGHPIADTFGKTYLSAGISKRAVQELIDARTFDISGEIMPDSHALKTYLTKTAGNVFLLAAQILSETKTEDFEMISRVAGYSYGLTGLLRSLPVHVARGQLFLPANHLSDYGVNQTELIQAKDSQALHAALGALRTEAREALAEACELIPSIPETSKPAFMPLSLVEPYLKALERPSHRPLHQIAGINPLLRLWRMWRWI